MRKSQQFERQHGFTLIEIIVGLAVSSLILVSLNLVMGTISRGFESSTHAIGRQTAISTALDIVGTDISRIERLRETASDKKRFLFDGQARHMIYALAERPGNNRAGLYIVRMYVRKRDGNEELVRERAPLAVGSYSLENINWQDEVVLIGGPFDIRFDYRAQRSGLHSWAPVWNAADMMPEQVRLTVTDIATGRLRIPVFVQSLMIEAETVCVTPEAENCLKADGASAK